MSIFREVAMRNLAPVRYGDGEGEYMLSWAAGALLRKLRERHPDIFSELSAEVVRENAEASPTGAELAERALAPPREIGPDADPDTAETDRLASEREASQEE